MLLASAASLRPAYLDAAEELRDNPGQWQVYQSRGSCVVLAGPGSGKTKTLTIKVARILAEDVRPPRGVACISFNNECVRELRRRLDRLGVNDRENIFVGTVHSFCLRHILVPYGKLAGLPLPDPIKVASERQQERLLEFAMREVGLEEPVFRWKERVELYRRTHLESGGSVAGDECRLARTYEALLRRNGLVDFEDIVRLGLRAIRDNAWVRRAVRARFPVLVVDEYQDLGVALHEIVLSLCVEGGIRLLAVGDPDQSIYGFAGAKPELLKELSAINGFETIRLNFNYRSGQRLVDASQVVLGENRGYKSRREEMGLINFCECPNGIEDQARQICESILPGALERRPGRTWGDLAVLYLDWRDGEVIARQAAQSGIKYIRIDKGAPYSKTPLIRWLEDCAVWCSGGWRRGMPRLSDLLRTWMGFNRTARTEADIRRCRSGLIKFLCSRRTPDASLRAWLADFIATCIQETLEREHDLADEVEALARLLRACEPGGSLGEYSVATFAGQGGSPDHLNLITLHSAKGLEFDVVVMMGMEQGRIPRLDAGDREKRESRRLFYVGLTRARHEVHITYSGWYVQRSQVMSLGPSEFVVELQRRLL